MAIKKRFSRAPCPTSRLEEVIRGDFTPQCASPTRKPEMGFAFNSNFIRPTSFAALDSLRNFASASARDLWSKRRITSRDPKCIRSSQIASLRKLPNCDPNYEINTDYAPYKERGMQRQSVSHYCIRLRAPNAETKEKQLQFGDFRYSRLTRAARESFVSPFITQ